MIGLDTNVIARIVLADDAAQTRQATAMLEAAQQRREEVSLSLPVVLELEWVLRSAAKLSKTAVITTLRHLLETELLQIEQEGALEYALHLYEGSKADFAECLFTAKYRMQGCRVMVSFDVQACKLDGVVLPGDLLEDIRR
jgi:predicted nucleic-acid-binding protein